MDVGFDDDEIVTAPAKALAVAQGQEGARVTLYRALDTILVMLDKRGFEPVQIGDTTVKSQAEAKTAIAHYKPKERAAEAERIHEILLEAEVPASPREGTTAYAQGLAPGTRLMAIIISNGNVSTMRDVIDTMKTEGTSHVLLLHRISLTPYSAKFIAELDPHYLRVDAFTLADLQRPKCNHKLTPRHVPITRRQGEQVKKRYASFTTDGKPDARLFRLKTTDAMAKFLGLAANDIVAVLMCVGREQPVVEFYEVSNV